MLQVIKLLISDCTISCRLSAVEHCYVGVTGKSIERSTELEDIMCYNQDNKTSNVSKCVFIYIIFHVVVCDKFQHLQLS